MDIHAWLSNSLCVVFGKKKKRILKRCEIFLKCLPGAFVMDTSTKHKELCIVFLWPPFLFLFTFYFFLTLSHIWFSLYKKTSLSLKQNFTHVAHGFLFAREKNTCCLICRRRTVNYICKHCIGYFTLVMESLPTTKEYGKVCVKLSSH